ncbi:glycosyltransferase family protein [Ruegeria sp.]|uniref:glycosyltransferase family protein n=1 Tax=Ruegeria sp. TaxID=1879320 RepID=UPI003C7E034C
MEKPLSFSILLPVGSEKRKYSHGDYFFGRSFADALERRGHKTKLLSRDNWDQTLADDIAIVIRGRAAPDRRFGRLTLAWCISFQPKEVAGDYDHTDHFFAASPLQQRVISRRAGQGKVDLMYQAFDSHIMFPTDEKPTNDLVFVGTPRSVDRRPVVSFAAQSGLPTRIWGDGWENTEFASMQAGGNVQNSQLGSIYRSGSVVLNDHLVIMKRSQLVSNRVYDALACGRPVLTDAKAGLPEELQPYVYEYRDADSFTEAAHAALNETEEKRQDRLDLALRLPDLHSFDQRAVQTCAVVERLLQADRQK